MIQQRRLTVEEVREHDARTRRGWGRWWRTDAEGNGQQELLRRCGSAVERFLGHGRLDVCDEAFLTARWTPLDYETQLPEAGASEEYRVEVLKALIDNTMAKRGCGTVRTDFNPCAMAGFQWTAFVRSNAPREGDDARIAGRTPFAEAERGTEVDSLEALALFLGATE